MLSSEPRSINGISAFSALDSICFGVSSLMSVRSCNESSGRFLGSVRV